MIKSLDDCVTATLALVPDTVAERFVQAPRETLEQDLGLTVKQAQHLAESRDGGGWCDGQSYLSDGVILYRPTGNRRENFTLAHELGHWLVDSAVGVYDWLSQQESGEQVLETVCDRVAQSLLVPARVVDAVVGSQPISAETVLDLLDATQASRPVCAIALARRLPGTGAVVVIDRDTNTVAYSSVQPDPVDGWPVAVPWPGQRVPAGHPLLRVADGGSLRKKSHWVTQWGKRQEFYISALGLSRVVVVVFVDRDLWGVESLHFDAPTEFSQRLEAEIHCCGGTQTARGFPCPQCRRLYCPKCGGCLCTQRAANERTCRACGLQMAKHLIGSSGICVDCE